MNVSKPPIPEAVLAWLLEPSEPSVRYLTLVELLDRSKRDAEVCEARRSIMETGPVPRILAKQREDAYWGRLQTNIENRGKPSKWVTLTALRVMKRMGTRV